MVVHQLHNVDPPPGKEVVEAQNIVTLIQQPFTEM
jgi:hypothetical protein